MDTIELPSDKNMPRDDAEIFVNCVLVSMKRGGDAGDVLMKRAQREED